MRLEKVYSLFSVLVKSQLRAGRSGRFAERLFNRPVSMLVIDAIGFGGALVVGFLVGGAFPAIPEPYYTQLITAMKQAFVLIPLLVPVMVLLPGILFELSVSSKFASSDTVNWLPVTQSEYATASSISVAFVYSFFPAIILGFMLPIALVLRLVPVWAEMLALTIVSLFLGSVLVEILRAAINRVSSAVMVRARRGALVLRLVVVVLVILVFQFVFNFVFLQQLLSGFYGSVGSVQFIPLFWASLSVKYLMSDDALLSGLFFAGSVAFTLVMLWIAAKVRTRYWVPVPVTIRVTRAEYRPGSLGMLSRLGFSPAERAIIRKDLKGFGRRRELIQFFAIPFVFTAVLILEGTLGSQAGQSSAGFGLTFPIFFVGGIFSLMMSSISFGQESTAVMNLYSLPISPRELLRAKAFTSLLVSMAATIGLFILTLVLGATKGTDALIVFCIACVLTVEENFLGLAFGARYPDFQERPRPRFVDPIAIIGAVFLGLALMFIAALPIFLAAIFTSMGSTYFYLVAFSIIFSVAFTVFAYRWASSGVRGLLAEMRK